MHSRSLKRDRRTSPQRIWKTPVTSSSFPNERHSLSLCRQHGPELGVSHTALRTRIIGLQAHWYFWGFRQIFVKLANDISTCHQYSHAFATPREHARRGRCDWLLGRLLRAGAVQFLPQTCLDNRRQTTTALGKELTHARGSGKTKASTHRACIAYCFT